MSKKVAIGARPSGQAATPENADSWVQSRSDGAATEVTKQPLKRLTVDIPAELHARLKAQCAMRGVKITDEIRKLLEERFKD